MLNGQYSFRTGERSVGVSLLLLVVAMSRILVKKEMVWSDVWELLLLLLIGEEVVGFFHLMPLSGELLAVADLGIQISWYINFSDLLKVWCLFDWLIKWSSPIIPIARFLIRSGLLRSILLIWFVSSVRVEGFLGRCLMRVL